MLETKGTHEHDVQSILLSSDKEDISESDNNMINHGVIEISDDEYDKQPTFETNNTITNTTTNTTTNRISSSFQLSSDDNKKRSVTVNIKTCNLVRTLILPIKNKQ